MSTVRPHDDVVSTPGTWGSGIADPGPLGLAGFAATTFFLSAANTNMLPESVTAVVLGLALFYGGLAQLLAGMWEFAKGNTFGALAFGPYGAFWLSFWYLLNHVPAGASPHDLNKGLGTYLLVWTIFTFYLFIASTRTSGILMAVVGFLFLTFLFLTIGKYADSTGWTKVGGWFGFVTALLAWYASFAGVMNATCASGRPCRRSRVRFGP